MNDRYSAHHSEGPEFMHRAVCLLSVFIPLNLRLMTALRTSEHRLWIKVHYHGEAAGLSWEDIFSALGKIKDMVLLH